MTTGSTSGLQLAGLASAVALYAGILAYLEIQGTESLDLARHGEAVNAQLQADLQRKESGNSSIASNELAGQEISGDPEQRVVRPLSGGIFATAMPEQDEQPQAVENAADSDSTTADASASQSDQSETAPESGYVAVQPAAYGYAYPSIYPAGYPVALSGSDAMAGWNYADYSAYQDSYGNLWHDGRGNARGRGQGRGNGRGEGEFSFSMRFASRLRADADVDADSDWNADSHGRQDIGNGYYGQQYQGVQTYYSAYR